MRTTGIRAIQPTRRRLAKSAGINVQSTRRLTTQELETLAHHPQIKAVLDQVWTLGVKAGADAGAKAGAVAGVKAVLATRPPVLNVRVIASPDRITRLERDATGQVIGSVSTDVA